jgi:hypothetical protein
VFRITKDYKLFNFIVLVAVDRGGCLYDGFVLIFSLSCAVGTLALVITAEFSSAVIVICREISRVQEGGRLLTCGA